MNKIEQAIKIIESDQPMECVCKYCEDKRWAYEMAIEALCKKAEPEEERRETD